MAKFIIVRHGSNAANQSMQFRKVLGTIEAEDSREAKEKAAEKWSCYNNQHFEAIDLAGRTRKADREEAFEKDALMAEASANWKSEEARALEEAGR